MSFKFSNLTFNGIGPWYNVHKNLVRGTSDLIENELQERRQVVKGDCCICDEPLVPDEYIMTLCKPECGFHKHCVDLKVGEQNLVECTVCGEDMEVNTLIWITRNQVDQETVDRYYIWLYTK